MKMIAIAMLLMNACSGQDPQSEKYPDTLTLWKPTHRMKGVFEYTSKEHEVREFDHAVISWNATGSVRIEMRVRTKEWQPWCVMGEWGGAESKSAKYVGGGEVDVEVDTLVSKKPAAAFQFRLKLEDGAEVTRIAVTHWKNGEKSALSEKPSPAWGKILKVPERSQMVEDQKIRGLICSPTSLSMALEFHGFKFTTREVADGVLDHESKLYGNWPFNTAHACVASKGKLETFVLRGMGMEDIEREIEAGRPVVLSHQWNKGDLTNAPIESSDGHLILVIGFTKEGDVVVNDPAARPGSVQRTYKRAEIYKTWLDRGCGILYILRPSK